MAIVVGEDLIWFVVRENIVAGLWVFAVVVEFENVAHLFVLVLVSAVIVEIGVVDAGLELFKIKFKEFLLRKYINAN